MKTDDVLDQLRRMYLDYTKRKIGLTPALLPEHLAEFLGYTNLLYSHYSEFIVKYREAEASVLAEENDQRDEVNQVATKREDKRTVDEKNDRITIRMAGLKGKRERLEAETKSATLHINTIQSLMKRYGDEAKGMM
jgi:hypothetical protein